MRMSSRSLALTVCALASAPAIAQPTPTFTNVPYGDGHQRQVLDIYLPSGNASSPRPAVFWFHGGGWESGSKAGAANRAAELLERGIAVVGINYRYSSHATFPAQIHDCKGAIRWLRANAAAYNIDPGRIGVWGASSGGHLAALTGTSGGVAALEGTVGGNTGQSSTVQAVIDYYGHSDFFLVHAEYATCGGSESALLGQCLSLIQQNRHNPEWASWVALTEQASPVTHVSADDPPFRIVHGLADTRVLPIHSQVLRDALVAAGVPAPMTLIPNAPHDIGHGEDQTTADLLARWLAHPTCTTDWNNDGSVNSSDISAFLTTWLTSLTVVSPGGDFDESGAVNSSDISAYLSAWLSQVGGC